MAEPKFCTECGDAYRRVRRLGGNGMDVNMCPLCFEEAMNEA